MKHKNHKQHNANRRRKYRENPIPIRERQKQRYNTNEQFRKRHLKRSMDYYEKNKTLILARQKERYAQNPKPFRDRIERRRLLKEYGITPEQKMAMLKAQGGRCAICRTASSGKHSWHTDHDHETSEVRGLLCFQCNAMIGFAKDDLLILSAAIEYLSRYLRK